MSIAQTRRDYHAGSLDEGDLAADPVEQFARWMEQALAAHLLEPTAVTLCTADPEGRPSGRTVLLKAYDSGGFVVYTNYRSRKGRELEANPHAALVCYWPSLDRQVVVTGSVVRVPTAESDAYFATRPRGSQLSAWASPQSDVIPSRRALDARIAELDREYAEGDVPRPPHWGGYRIRPETVTFWQGRPDRLHDRLRYRRDGSQWIIERLAP